MKASAFLAASLDGFIARENTFVRGRIAMRLCAGLIVTLLVADGALAQDGGFIVIYRNQASHSNILRFPAEARESLKPVIQGGRAELVDWPAFKSEPQRYLAPLVIKNEYPASDLAKELVALLEGNPGLGFAVTWTGGIAVTKEDRLHAERSYALFRQNPDEYERTKVSGDRARDPVHPENRLSQLRPKPRQGPWWTCEDDKYREKDVNPDQQQRLDAFALRLFTPKPQGPDEMDEYFPRSELVRRFGTPTGSKSEKVRASPRDPTDDTIWEMTTWEFPGMRITTRAEKPGSDVLSIEEGEIFDANVPIRDGLRIGQPVERWVDRFGRPECRMRQIEPFGRDHVAYEWNARYFACTEDKTYPCDGAYRIELYLDAAGRVKRMKWMLAPMH